MFTAAVVVVALAVVFALAYALLVGIFLWQEQTMETPLAGHAGHCNKVLMATIGKGTDGPCSCGATRGPAT